MKKQHSKKPASPPTASLVLHTVDHKTLVEKYRSVKGKVRRISHDWPSGESDTETTAVAFASPSGRVVVIHGDQWRFLEDTGHLDEVLSLLVADALTEGKLQEFLSCDARVACGG